MRVRGILAGSGILAVLIQPLVLKIPFIRVVLDWAVLQAIHSPTTFVCVSPVRFHNFQQAVLFLFQGKENWEMAREIINKKRICYAGARVTRWHELVPKQGAQMTWWHKPIIKQGSRSFWRRGCFVSANSTSRAEKYEFKREWKIGKGWPWFAMSQELVMTAEVTDSHEMCLLR